MIAAGFPRVPLVRWIQDGSADARGQQRAVSKSSYERPEKVGRLEDASLSESSGLAASWANPGLLWTHNDSGYDPLIYCIEPSGESCGVWEVAGAGAQDWEDIAVGPGPEAGQSYAYVGDIGDNYQARETVTVYRVPEPSVDPSSQRSTSASPRATAAASAIELRYPDGSHDAEVLLVHRHSGDLYIITKELVSAVYKAPAPLRTSDVTKLERVASFSIFANLSDRTGGSISPDGTRVALSTYGGAFELALPAATSGRPGAAFDSIWDRRPARIGVADLSQSEAITYTVDGSAVILTGEGRRVPIYRVTRNAEAR